MRQGKERVELQDIPVLFGKLKCAVGKKERDEEALPSKVSCVRAKPSPLTCRLSWEFRATAQTKKPGEISAISPGEVWAKPQIDDSISVSLENSTLPTLGATVP